jgi:hypothetical protein
MIPVKLVRKEGPVIIPSLNGAGTHASYPMWDGIAASETYPPHVESASYIVELSKVPASASEVENVNAQLADVLRLLAACWPFCGGSFMAVDTRQVSNTLAATSNAADVREALERQAGIRTVSVSLTANVEVLGTYMRPPLASAVQVAMTAHSDAAVEALLRYHQSAWLDYHRGPRLSWFIDLYKVRDALKTIYGNNRSAQAALGISDADWEYAGKILNNNDLRHAEISGRMPSLDDATVTKLFDLARLWVHSYLKMRGLPVT